MDACVVVVGASLFLVAAVSLYLLRRRRMDTALTRPLTASENQTANFTGITYRIINVLTGEKPHGLANPEVIKTIAVMRGGDPGRWAGVPDFSTALQV